MAVHMLAAKVTTTVAKPSVNLVSGWDKIWSGAHASPGFSALEKLIAIAGVVLVLSSVLRYIWARRGGKGDHKHVIATLVFGAVLLVPTVMVPILLTAADVVINTLVHVA
jgi:hypothetical protein